MTADASGTGVPRGRMTTATYVYVAVVVALALALLGLGWVTVGPPYDMVALVVLVALSVVSWVLRDTDVVHRVQISLISIVLLASAVIVGPVGAALVGMVATVFESRKAPTAVRLFNMAMVSAVGSVGGLVYLLAGGEQDVASLHSPTEIVVMVGLPLMVADIAQCVTNAVLFAGVTRLATGVPVRAQIVKLLSTTGLPYIGYGIIGFLFVVLWIPAKVGPFSALLVLAPLFVARWAFVQYGDELRSHERTLDALVASVEAKDPASLGHSGRVAQLCEWTAESLGLGHREIQEVRTAGMLHDLGKLAVPSRVLRMRRERSDDEQVLLAEHPLHALEMLSEIEFVKGSLDGIAHHHERYDGRGFPSGLAGNGIPLAARIIAVADAFDALTTTRSYRSALAPADALEELRSRGGSQLDPYVVSALGRALARHTWSVTERSGALLAASGANRDHDDPESSDALAERADLRARLAQASEGLREKVGS